METFQSTYFCLEVFSRCESLFRKDMANANVIASEFQLHIFHHLLHPSTSLRISPLHSILPLHAHHCSIPTSVSTITPPPSPSSSSSLPTKEPSYSDPSSGVSQPLSKLSEPQSTRSSARAVCAVTAGDSWGTSLSRATGLLLGSRGMGGVWGGYC